MLWRNIVASKSYRSGRKEAVIATDSYRFDKSDNA
jgi:hypothetical protein